MYILDAWMGLFRLQPDFRIRDLSESNKNGVKMLFCMRFFTFQDSNFNPVPFMLMIGLNEEVGWHDFVMVAIAQGN